MVLGQSDCLLVFSTDLRLQHREREGERERCVSEGQALLDFHLGIIGVRKGLNDRDTDDAYLKWFMTLRPPPYLDTELHWHRGSLTLVKKILLIVISCVWSDKMYL